MRAGVINIGSPSALTPRPSLPARKLDAYFAGAGDTCESPRWSIGGRYAARKKEECSRKEFVETPKAVFEEELTEGLRKNARVSRHEGETAAPDGRRNESCDDLTARQECAEDSEEDDGLLSFSKQVSLWGHQHFGLKTKIRNYCQNIFSIGPLFPGSNESADSCRHRLQDRRAVLAHSP